MDNDIVMPCEFLAKFQETRIHSKTRDNHKFRETRTHSKTRGDCHMSTFRSGRDNFIGITAIDFVNSFTIFTNSVDICHFLCQLSRFVDKNEHITMQRMWSTLTGTCGWGGDFRTSDSSFIGKTPSSLEFQVSPMSQPDFFPPMTLKSC